MEQKYSVFKTYKNLPFGNLGMGIMGIRIQIQFFTKSQTVDQRPATLLGDILKRYLAENFPII